MKKMPLKGRENNSIRFAIQNDQEVQADSLGKTISYNIGMKAVTVDRYLTEAAVKKVQVMTA